MERNGKYFVIGLLVSAALVLMTISTFHFYGVGDHFITFTTWTYQMSFSLTGLLVALWVNNYESTKTVEVVCFSCNKQRDLVKIKNREDQLLVDSTYDYKTGHHIYGDICIDCMDHHEL